MFGFAIGQRQRTAPPWSDEMVARSVPDATAENVVNVIRSIRGLDTLGEITVLAVASIGAVAAGPGRRGRPRSSVPTEVAGSAAVARTPLSGSCFVDDLGRLIFHVVIRRRSGCSSRGTTNRAAVRRWVAGGSAITLRYVAGGIAESAAGRGSGLDRDRGRAAAGRRTAAAPLRRGRRVDIASHRWTVPLFDEVKMSSGCCSTRCLPGGSAWC